MKTFVVVGGSNDICFLSAPSHEGIKVKQSKSIFRKTKLAQLMVKANCECKIWHKISQVRIFLGNSGDVEILLLVPVSTCINSVSPAQKN